MVIKSEEDDGTSDSPKSPKRRVTRQSSRNAATAEISSPPQKRVKVENGEHESEPRTDKSENQPATKPVVPTTETTSLQETLSTVISNLSELPANQLVTLASLLSKTLSNGSSPSPTPEHNVPGFNCDMCKATFTSQSDYFKHITFDHETDCGICQASFSDHMSLEYHVKDQHSVKTGNLKEPVTGRYTCTLCSFTFHDEVELQAHLYTHRVTFTCDICGEVFSEHRNLELHLKTFHEKHKPHCCVMCKESFCTASELYKHISFCHDLDCTVCHLPFTSAALLKKHVQDRHTFQCCACEESGVTKVFYTVESYDIHLDHFHKGTQFFKCIKCSQRYTSLPEFQSHVMEAHQAKPGETDSFNKDNNQESPSKKETMGCRICSEVVDKDHIHRHIRDQHQFNCLFCETKCDGDDELEEHMVEVHRRSCDICDISFRVNYLLKEHFALHHAEMAPVKCWYCEEHFILAYKLSHHCRNTHFSQMGLEKAVQSDKQDGKLACNMCKDSFETKEKLAKHTKLNHSTKCNVAHCRASTCATVRDLDFHTWISHWHKCSFCEKVMSSKTLVRSHIAEQHPVKQGVVCTVCLQHFTSKDEVDSHISSSVSCKRALSLICSICKTKCSSKKDLDVHIAKHQDLDKSFYSCDVCSHCFHSEEALHKHIAVYHENIVFFNCNKCSKKTLSKPELDRHIESLHKDDYSYTTCDICKEQFTNQSDYYKHVSFAHDPRAPVPEDDGEFQCDQCSGAFSTEQFLKEHQVITHHQKHKYFVCKMCGNKFTSYYRLTRHVKVEHKGNEHLCDLCNKSFASPTALYRHQKMAHESDLGCKICLTCGGRLSDQEALLEHVKEHLKSAELKCKQCHISFTTIAGLNEHMLFHQKQEYRCIDCGKTFSSKTDLKVHVSVDHVGMVLCSICEEAFADDNSLQIHVKFQHSNDSYKSYRCSDCGDCFNSSRELKVHVTLKHLGNDVTSTVEGVAPKYNCIDCMESFGDKQSLKIHIASNHGANSYCSLCYKVFPTKEKLNVHECHGRVIKCNQCSSKFKTKSELEEHMITHIPLNVNKHYCTSCNNQFTSKTDLDDHDCGAKQDQDEPSTKPLTKDLQLLLQTLTGPLTGAVLKKDDQQTPPPPLVKVKPDPSPVPSPSKDQKICNTALADMISTLFGPSLGGVSSQAVLEALSELSPAKLRELLSTLSLSPNTILTTPAGTSPTKGGVLSSLAANPPKLPSSLSMIRGTRTEALPCPRCSNEFITKQALASHLQTCAIPAPAPNKPAASNKPSLKLIHKQLFIAAQNIDVGLLNINQVETLIQVLASEEGVKNVPQHKVIDLLDTIEKSVKAKEARERELKKQKKLSSSPRTTPPVTSPATPKPATPRQASPAKPPGRASPAKPPSLTDCLPPQIIAAILPAIKEEDTDLTLLTKVCTAMGGCEVTLPQSINTHLSLSVTKSIQILRHPDPTNKSTLSELKAIIISILGGNSSSNNSIKLGILNVLKRNYRSEDMRSVPVCDLDKFVHYLVTEVLPSLGNLSPNLLTLPFLLDLVLKNDKTNGPTTSTAAPSLNNSLNTFTTAIST